MRVPHALVAAVEVPGRMLLVPSLGLPRDGPRFFEKRQSDVLTLDERVLYELCSLHPLAIVDVQESGHQAAGFHWQEVSPVLASLDFSE